MKKIISIFYFYLCFVNLVFCQLPRVDCDTLAGKWEVSDFGEKFFEIDDFVLLLKAQITKTPLWDTIDNGIVYNICEDKYQIINRLGTPNIDYFVQDTTQIRKISGSILVRDFCITSKYAYILYESPKYEVKKTPLQFTHIASKWIVVRYNHKKKWYLSLRDNLDGYDIVKISDTELSLSEYQNNALWSFASIVPSAVGAVSGFQGKEMGKHPIASDYYVCYMSLTSSYKTVKARHAVTLMFMPRYDQDREYHPFPITYNFSQNAFYYKYLCHSFLLKNMRRLHQFEQPLGKNVFPY